MKTFSKLANAMMSIAVWVGWRTASPLTPALSPLRGEGPRPTASALRTRLAAFETPPPSDQAADLRRRAFEFQQTSIATPSPLNKRAGVRGESSRTLPKLGTTPSLKFAGIITGLALASTLPAFPPAPHHTLYGQVRNQWGDPISVSPSDVYLETPSGTQLHTSLVNGLEPGVNYRLEVPMDSGTSADANAYKPTALKPFFQFKLKVLIGQTIYLPIEMVGNFAQIGQPSLKTRLDLTLGVDSDGDGLPDAWEQALIDIYGGTLASIRPGDDADGDGISNLDEYLAGTYAFDPTDGFALSILGVNNDHSQLEFMAIRGRTYTIQQSPNLQQWTTANFRFVTSGAPGTLQNSYRATDVRLLRVEVPVSADAGTNRFFRALVQ